MTTPSRIIVVGAPRVDCAKSMAMETTVVKESE